MPKEDIQYSSLYEDAEYFYRHVILPPDLAKLVPKTSLMTETERRNIGIDMPFDWVQVPYMCRDPEPRIIPFTKRKSTTQLNDD